MKINEYIEITNEDNMELMSRYPDNYFDLAIVDPPYGIMDKHYRKNKTGMTKGCFNEIKEKGWDNTIPSDEYFKELFRVSKNQIIWGGNYFLDYLGATSCFLIWDKQNGTNNMSDAELAWASFETSVRIYKGHIFKGIGCTKYKTIHPTQKPILLYQWILQKYAKENYKILDTHLGSGSIAVALDSVNKIEKMNLTLTACEIDADYFKTSTDNVISQINWTSLF